MSNINNCSLCKLQKELQNSHIIPRAYYKSLKGRSGQLITINKSKNEASLLEVKLSNADPKEKLLCWDCEQLLSANYEQYGTRLFKDYRNVQKTKDNVVFNQFRYKEFYLFLISILWRASISSLQQYEHILLGKEINELLRVCLKENKIKINSSIKLDQFIKISLIRIVDKTDQLSDEDIKNTLFDLSFEKGATIDDGILWYMMVEGFLIVYYFSTEEDLNSAKARKNYAQITNKQKLIIPISDICNFSQLSNGFISITKHAVKHNKNRG
jgi:hypothetical protein